MKTIKLLIIIILNISFVANATAERKTLVIGGDYWCPYNCNPEDKNPGYLVELVSRALYIYGIDIEYKMMPWHEALTQIDEGKIDGIIGISNLKGKNLVATALPLDYSATSSFTRNDTEWVYDGIPSLRGKKIGMVMDYVLSESISHYVGINYPQNPGGFVIEDSDSGVISSITNLIEGKIDIYIEDKRVVNHYLREHKLESTIKDSGKIDNESAPVYVAFSDKIPHINKYIKQLEDGIASLKATGEYEDLRAKYFMDEHEL